MTTRSRRLAANLALLLALAAAVSLASSGAATAADRIHPSTAICPVDSSFRIEERSTQPAVAAPLNCCTATAAERTKMGTATINVATDFLRA